MQSLTTADPLILAIDLGTSGPKVCVLTRTGMIVASTVEKTKTHFLPDGGVEQDPGEWWRVIRQGVATVLAAPQINRDRIVAIACTAQWSGTVALDSAGKPLGRAIIWMDSRGARHIQELIDGLVKVEGYSLPKLVRWIRRTGGAPGKAGKDSLAHILYMKNVHPEQYHRTAMFLEPKDYLNYLFTGRYGSSYDSMTLHWLTDNRDIHGIRYDEGLMRICGLDARKFPPLAPATSVLGAILPEIAREFGLDPQTPVVVGSPDIPSAAVGSGAVADYQAHLCVGTSSWITCHVPFKKTDLFNNMATLPSALPGRYFIANEQESAGICLEYLKNNVIAGDSCDGRSEESFAALERLAETASSGSGNIIFTPWLNGERTPVENHTLRGGFHNLSLGNQRGDFVRAVYEGVAYNSKWLLSCVEKFIKRPLQDIHMIGGGAASNLWCQIHADVLERSIKQITDPRMANARGAAWIAAIALGLITVADIPDLVRVQRVFSPRDTGTSAYRKQFREFLNIYRSNKKIYGRLNC